jgi:arsenate reductase
MKFRSMGLGDKTLSEQDYRKLILEEYTFLKRPVFLTDEGVTASSAKAEVARARDLIS